VVVDAETESADRESRLIWDDGERSEMTQQGELIREQPQGNQHVDVLEKKEN
jgi:hypothetical protein